MKRPIPQYEFGFAGAAFNMAGEATLDGARVAAEREQAAQDRAESQARQNIIPENRGMMKALSTIQGVG